MHSQFLETNEAEERCEEALQSKFCELTNQLWRADSLRAMTLAQLQTVQTEINLGRVRQAHPRRAPRAGRAGARGPGWARR